MNFTERIKILPYIPPLINQTLKTNLNGFSTSHVKFNEKLNVKRGTFIKSNRIQDKDVLYNVVTGETITTEDGIFYEVYPQLYTMQECRLLESILRYFS